MPTFEPIFLTVDEVVEIHHDQIDLYGGSHGLRDRGVLESAVATPAATFGGEYLHASIPQIAAAYLYHLCQGHAFIDGNKRVGTEAAITFLGMNDWELTLEPDELTALVLGVASGVVTKAKLTSTFEDRCRPLSPIGDQPSR